MHFNFGPLLCHREPGQLSKGPSSSEDYLSSQLHLPRWCRGGVQQPGIPRGYLIKAESPLEGEIIRRSLEVGMVEDIERFHSQLKVDRLGHTNIFHEG